MKNWIALPLLTAGLLALALQADARPGFGRDSMDPLDHIERMTEHLALTAEQDQQITDLVNAAQITNAVDRERMHQVHEELRAMTENFDDGAAQALADEMGQIVGRLAYSRASTMAGVFAVFTPEQLEQLQAMRAHREQFRQQFGDSRRTLFNG